MVVTGSEPAGAKGQYKSGMAPFQLAGVTGFGLTTSDARDILQAKLDSGEPLSIQDLTTATQAGVNPENWVSALSPGDEMAWENVIVTQGKETTGDSFIKSGGALGDSLGEVWGDASAAALGLNESGQKCRDEGGMTVCDDSWMNELGQLCQGQQTSGGSWFEQCTDIVNGLNGNGDNGTDDTTGTTGNGNGGSNGTGGAGTTGTNNVTNVFNDIIGGDSFYGDSSSASTTSGSTTSGSSAPTKKPVSYWDAMIGGSGQPTKPQRKVVYMDADYDF